MASEYGYRCSKCGSRSTEIIDKRPAGAYTVRRRRRCECGNRFTTFEISAEEYAVISALDSGAINKAKKAAEAFIKIIDQMAKGPPK